MVSNFTFPFFIITSEAIFISIEVHHLYKCMAEKQTFYLIYQVCLVTEKKLVVIFMKCV